jgi:hypothetical protein
MLIENCDDVPRKPRPVLTKTDFVRRYQAGEFGNRAPTWGTIVEWWSEDPVPWVRYGRNFHVRSRIANGPTYYNLDAGIISQFWRDLCKEHGEENLYISAMAPHEHNLLQGEVQQGPWGLQLHYSTEPRVPMRGALSKSPQDAEGTRAKLLLDWCMNDLSRQWLDYLLEAYPDHVIEFSSFGVCWGTVLGHNAVFWEVRKY